jgi:hypothetical protein
MDAPQIMDAPQTIRFKTTKDPFDNPTEGEIILLWKSFRSAGLSAKEAWDAIVAGIALDMAFSRTKTLSQIEQ